MHFSALLRPSEATDPQLRMPQRLRNAFLTTDKSLMAEEPIALAPPPTSDDGHAHLHPLPRGFEFCPREHACPSCRSALVRKAAPGERPIKSDPSLDALEAEAGLQPSVRNDVASSLAAAHAANEILQALSFDAATLTERRELDAARLAEGVGYCPACKVHVIASAEELGRLFDECDDEDDGGMEWLRGSLLATVDDAEATAPSKQQEPICGSSSSFVLAPSELSSLPMQQSSIDQQSDPTIAHRSDAPVAAQECDAAGQPSRLPAKPTRPLEFDHEHRHEVAAHAMASRISRGSTLVEEVCPECEMPLMKNKKGKECVVCPKMWKEIEETHPDPDIAATQRNGAAKDQNHDPMFAITEEAHAESPQRNPEIAEAKQDAIQRRIMDGTVANVSHLVRGAAAAGSAGRCAGCDAGEACTASLTDQSSSTAEDDKVGASTPGGAAAINWEELLIDGRAVLSRRLKEGWLLSSHNCSGPHCKGTPLLRRRPDVEGLSSNDALEYCAVCGGLGTGLDGAYERELELAALAAREVSPDWDALLMNGRALLAERLTRGWTMSSENCSGCRCNGMPLTNFEGGPNDCVVCAGTGTGTDGRYEKYMPPDDEAVEVERDRVSQEISRLLSMGWVLRESLCARCLMPLVGEFHGAEEELCIVCGKLPENNRHIVNAGCDIGVSCGNDVVENHDSFGNDGDGNNDSDGDDSYMNTGVDNNNSYGDDSHMNEYNANEDNKAGNDSHNKGDHMNELCADRAIGEANLNDNTNESCADKASNETPNIDEDPNINDVNDSYADEEIDQTDPNDGIKEEPKLALGDNFNKNKLEEQVEVNIEDAEEGQGPSFKEILKEVVNAPVPKFGDENTDRAGEYLVMGWALPDVGPCHNCGGVLMSAPSSPKVGCINRGCPSALAAAFDSLPSPYHSTGPVILIGRGFTKPSNEEDELEDMYVNDVKEEQRQGWEYEERYDDYYHDNTQVPCLEPIQYDKYYHDNAQGIAPEGWYYEEQYLKPTQHDNGPPPGVFSETVHQGPNRDEPSVLGEDLMEVRSVASGALGVILVRLDDAKCELEEMREGAGDPRECAQKQVEIAMLVERLAGAAVAMKRAE